MGSRAAYKIPCLRGKTPCRHGPCRRRLPLTCRCHRDRMATRASPVVPIPIPMPIPLPAPFVPSSSRRPSRSARRSTGTTPSLLSHRVRPSTESVRAASQPCPGLHSRCSARLWRAGRPHAGQRHSVGGRPCGQRLQSKDFVVTPDNGPFRPALDAGAGVSGHVQFPNSPGSSVGSPHNTTSSTPPSSSMVASEPGYNKSSGTNQCISHSFRRSSGPTSGSSSSTSSPSTSRPTHCTSLPSGFNCTW